MDLKQINMMIKILNQLIILIIDNKILINKKKIKNKTNKKFYTSK